jgi:3',5'-cyclic AMP phosphodiesterase CpdA
MAVVKSDAPPSDAAFGTETAPSPASARTCCIAHLSDLHLFHPQHMRMRDFRTKRVLGYLSWRLHRRYEHQVDFLPPLLKALNSADVNHVVITGDLTHLGHSADFEAAAGVLEKLGGPGRLTLVPGNHDAYIRNPWHERRFTLAEYITSGTDFGNPSQSGATRQPVPSFKRCGDTAVIGISSALPSAPFMATGSIGRTQLERLRRLLVQTRKENLFRLLLIHHPPIRGMVSRRKCLTDQPALAEVLGEVGAELIWHGHTHRFSDAAIAGPTGRIPVVGVASLTALSGRGKRRAGFHLNRIRRAGHGWEVDISVYRYSLSRAAFVHSDNRTLAIPPPG